MCAVNKFKLKKISIQWKFIIYTIYYFDQNISNAREGEREKKGTSNN